ncbi:MAG: helix-turn-helix domain-containing protein [Armatimonadetes bacterium]|nr:helix-turn-helix domain-containing protein [Armatimonadota bacterium]
MPTSSSAAPALYTVEEVAEKLRLQPETVRQMARDKRLPARKVGRVWRFVPEEVQAWLQSQPRSAEGAYVGASRVREAALRLPGLGESPEVNGSAFKDPAFSENRSLPVHRWVPWIAGFSAGFVQDCLREYLWRAEASQALVLDPFAGVGTTLVEAYRAGFNTVGFEINPYAVLAARAKLAAGEVSVPMLEAWTRIFNVFMEDNVARELPRQNGTSPPGFRSRIPFFSPQVEQQVSWALRFIRNTGDPELRDFFLIAFGSVMVKFSNYTYEPSLASRPGCGKPLVEIADVTGTMVGKLREMIEDCRRFQRGTQRSAYALRRDVFQDSFFNAERHLPPGCVDLAITSPPYLNNYHYIRNTRPQLFWLQFVERAADLQKIEQASFGRFWQTVRDGQRLDLEFQLPELEVILDQLRQTNLHRGVYGGPGWANYAAQYFNDAYRFCGVMARLLKPGGRTVVVIGNSILQGIEIKVEEFLAEIAEQHGLKREDVHMLRTKRVGNSIIRSSVRNAAKDRVSLYEVAVVLQKPPHTLA